MTSTLRTQIVVLEQGFVYVGHVRRDDDTLTINNAYNIRRWGTTRGLGELVDGPTQHTVLDRTGTVTAPMRAVIHMIDANEDAWTAHLSK